MDSSSPNSDLPESNSPRLHLSHPTPDEQVKIWTNTSASWKDALPLDVYLEESRFLATVPLAKDAGMTAWILTDTSLPPNNRPILCSCDSFRKRALTSDGQGRGRGRGRVEDGIVHGIASVFCPPMYRRRGYVARMMKELANVLPSWQVEQQQTRCIGSILYSDIGRTYYAQFGWHPVSANSHAVIELGKMPWPPLAKEVREGDLASLCQRDEVMVRKSMAAPVVTAAAAVVEGAKARISIVPDLDHMRWHIAKEDFASKYLFGKVPQAKGAIVGSPGNQTWAIWTHRYYDHPDGDGPHSNVLYILRLVIENEELESLKRIHSTKYTDQVESLKAVLQAAQHEAAEWKLDHIKLWNPSQIVQEMVSECGITYSMIDREEESIASGLWYDDNGQVGTPPVWLNNEHYAWC